VTALLDTLGMALATLRANPLRSLLTLLGIVIGGTTVVAMMALTEGLRLKVNSDLSQLGAGTFQVQKWPSGIQFGHGNRRKYEKRKDLTREHGEALRALPLVARVSIEAWQRERVRVWTRERSTQPNIQLCGGVPDYEHANAVVIGRGRFFSDVDTTLGRRVAVVGADVADLLFPGEDPLGKEIRIRSAAFEIVGVAERIGSTFGESRDAWVVVPIDAASQVLGKMTNHNIAIQATSPEDAPRAQDQVITALRRMRGVKTWEENDFELFSNESLSSTFNQLAAMVAAATFGICALALLVGGIGIMNIMLVSVSERTREIGIRMALGARRRRILAQFVVEAIALSLLGGVVGVLLGAAVSFGAREFFQIPASVPTWAVVLSLASATGCGIVFGIYPAVRASRLDPVEAMRTE
jgi:putative ABC transport system permease protein